MDDLADLDWSSRPSAPKKPPASNYNYNASAFAALKPTPPTSGRASPFNSISAQPPSKPATPANDSFSNLVSFSAAAASKNLPLQEQQKRLADLKRQQNENKAKTLQEQYSGGDEIWNSLGSGRSTPAVKAQQNGRNSTLRQEADEDDIFAAFSASSQKRQTQSPVPPVKTMKQPPEDDDDPFGLSEFTARKTAVVAPSASTFDDEDVLGLLGQPATNPPKAQHQVESPPPPSDAHPQDKAVAELVDMGFPANKARTALETTDSGTDVQAAVGWLLHQAHAEARERHQPRESVRNGHRDDLDAGQGRSGSNRVEQNRRQELQDGHMARSRRDPSAYSAVDKVPAQLAADFGNNFLKTAGSLWKTGTKKMQQAVQEFNSDSDSSQPRWMKESERASRTEQRPQRRNDEAGVARRRRRSSQTQAQPQPQSEASVTDEALLLETARPTPPPKPARSRHQSQFDSSADNSRDHSPAVPSRLRDAHSPPPAFLRPAPQKPPQQPPTSNPRAALSRQAIDDQAAQAYVSSARRRKPAAQPVAQPVAPVVEPDLLDEASKTNLPVRPAPIARLAQSTSPRAINSSLVNVRPPAPTRKIPEVSAISLKATHSHREKGNDHFKRGDYSSAHQCYATSISHLPPNHPLLIVLLTNHALTALKIGEPKTASTDADTAIAIIGPSKGEAETIDFSNGDAPKPMREYYGKALMRKAEALEQMEKWANAAAVWREAVEGGHGGATSMQGRLRAERAANPVAAAKPTPKLAKKPVVSTPAARLSKPSNAGTASAAAVTRLRAANLALERADDEKFALSDSVSARIQSWKGGKETNLRALLGSLDTVLWEGSGWKKISMADLVLPAKVKVQYMKGIARVHPDKIPTDATTEQRMISSAIFSALNEAWDKFKNENGL